MPAIDLSILNQRQTPAFYADVFANRPAAGFVGRIFVSTDTFAFYRDNGTGWDLIGGPGTGTITGSGSFGSIALWNGTNTITYDVGLTWDGTDNSLTASKFIVTGGTSSQFLKGDGSLDSNTYNTGSGAASQVAFFSGTNAITGENNLWWDSANNHLGINTNTPATALDVNHNGTLVAKFNNTTSANSLIAFENAGNEQWWIGTENTNNDFLFYDATNFPTLSLRTTFKTNGQVLIGGGSTGSGKLVVESATSDNGIQIVGANAPSLRIDSAATGPTKRIGLGISTGVNNFIQGSVDRDMCIFNGSTTASPMLFGIYDTTNVQEAARISAARNFLIGTTTDSGYKLNVAGTGRFNNDLEIGTVGGIGINVIPIINTSFPSSSVKATIGVANSGFGYSAGTLYLQPRTGVGAPLILGTEGTPKLLITSAGNVGIGTTTVTSKLQISSSFAGVATVAAFLLNENTDINTETRLAFAANANNDIATNRYSYISALNTSGSNGQALTFATNATGSAAVEAMRISSSQNVLIGTTTDTGRKLQVNGEIYSTKQTIENSTNGIQQTETIANSVNSQGYGYWRTYLRGIVGTGSGTKLNIPFVSQGNLNIVTIARVTILPADYNNANSPSSQFTFSVGHLNALTNLTILQSGGSYVSATTSGMNVIATIGGLTGAYIYVEYMTVNPAYSIDLGNITLTS